MRQEQPKLLSSAQNEVTMNKLFLVFAMTLFTIGCSSSSGDAGTVLQSNFGGILTIDGLRVGERLGRAAFQDAWSGGRDALTPPGPEDDGSCMIVLATDAPISAHHLERMARRAVMGLARTGSFIHHGSGSTSDRFHGHGAEHEGHHGSQEDSAEQHGIKD